MIGVSNLNHLTELFREQINFFMPLPSAGFTYVSEFLVEEQLGSNVDPGNIEEIADVVNYWLGMNSEQEKSHSERAYQYAFCNRSFENVIHKRYAIWNKYIDLYE